jgi:hypothetical protein
MKHNFDSKKSPLEIKVERAATILEKTVPEQTLGAMEDYARALEALADAGSDSAMNDIHLVPLVQTLRRLYATPTRGEHNAMLIELHDFKEFLYEARINTLLEERKKNLGEVPKSETKIKTWPWVIVSVIALIMLFKPSKNEVA